MNTNDSHKLRHSAMVKNASPHMNGGGPHTQVQKRPVVTTNDGTVVKRPNAPAMVARPVKKIRMGEDGSPQREVEVSSGGGGGKPQVESEGLNKYGKRMIKVRMDNGKPKADNGNTPGGKMMRVALPGRKASKNDPRYANLRAQRDQRQLAAAPMPEQGRVVQMQSAPLMSNEQLMLCLYAVKKYAESETNELIQAQCTLTMRTLDKLLTLHQGQSGAQLEEPVESEVMEQVDPNVVEIDVHQGETYDNAPIVERSQPLEPNKLSPDQYSELEQFEQEQQQAKVRTAQGNVRPFAARAPAKPAPIDTEPDESTKSE